MSLEICHFPPNAHRVSRGGGPHLWIQLGKSIFESSRRGFSGGLSIKCVIKRPFVVCGVPGKQCRDGGWTRSGRPGRDICYVSYVRTRGSVIKLRRRGKSRRTVDGKRWGRDCAGRWLHPDSQGPGSIKSVVQMLCWHGSNYRMLQYGSIGPHIT